MNVTGGCVHQVGGWFVLLYISKDPRKFTVCPRGGSLFSKQQHLSERRVKSHMQETITTMSQEEKSLLLYNCIVLRRVSVAVMCHFDAVGYFLKWKKKHCSSHAESWNYVTQKKTFPDILEVKSHRAAKTFEMSNSVDVRLSDLCKPIVPFHARVMQMMVQSAKSDVCKFSLPSPASLDLTSCSSMCTVRCDDPTKELPLNAIYCLLLNVIAIHLV